MEEENLTQTPVEKRTPITEAGNVISGLADIWEMWGDLNEKVNFFEHIFKEMWDDENTCGEAQTDKLKETEDLTDWNGEPFVPGFKAAIVQIATLQVSCAFAVQAMKAERDSPSAWAYVCEANHWLGILQGLISGRALENTDGKKTISKVAALGGKGRDALYEPLRELAKELVQNKNFKSKRNAAMSIAPNIINRSKELGLNMSEAQAPITIAGWLKDMRFAGKRNT